MPQIIVIVIFLLLLDHFWRNKRVSMMHYKNNHRFSIIIVIRHYHPRLESLFKMAEGSEHEFIFININEAVDKADYPTIRFVDHETSINPCLMKNRTPLLSEAYALGYKHASKEFLLFMDSRIEIKRMKTIDFMANNLVEHQVFTTKPHRVRHGIKDGHLIPFDLLMDMNCANDGLNFDMFAVKNNTYRLANCHEKVYQSVDEFENDVFRKNISFVHINHDYSLYITEEERPFKEQLHRQVDALFYLERSNGVKRLALMMIAFIALYITVYDPTLNFALAYLLAHFGLYLFMKPQMTHHPLSFLLLPFYWLWFIGISIYVFSKRKLGPMRANRRQKKRLKEEMKLQSALNAELDETQARVNPTENDVEASSEASKEENETSSNQAQIKPNVQPEPNAVNSKKKVEPED